MAKEVEKLFPQNISDMGAVDEDSGLRMFRGMITPWDQIKSFKETYLFLTRHAGLYGVGWINALKIIEPDYEKRVSAMSDCWAQSIQYMWSDVSGLHMKENFREGHQIPPFLEDGVYLSACFADQGDEFMAMPGYIWYASNDCVEKEIHHCPFDIIGPEACDVSIGGAQYFTRCAAGVPMKNYETERMGCGDPYCHVLFDTERKYGPHPNADGYDWEKWGPPTEGMREKGAPKKEECEFLTTGEYMSPLGARWTVGEMYQQAAGWPMAYSTNAVQAIRVLVKPEDMERTMNIVEVIFDTAGKHLFGDRKLREDARRWLGVPESVDDGRVLGGYISMILQARCLEWRFIEFSEERTIIECDKAGLEMMGQHPEFDRAYEAYFNGMAKTLVNCQWVVRLAQDAPEGKLRFIIEKGLYGFRRQKPGYQFEKGGTNHAE